MNIFKFPKEAYVYTRGVDNVIYNVELDDPKVTIKDSEPTITKTTAAMIEEIHEAFNTAHLAILEEANEFLDSFDKEQLKRGERLQKLGFTRMQEAQDAHMLRDEFAKKEDTAKNVIYYDNKYPLNKFITREKALEICKKYNLLLGEAQLYIGSIPEKNLKEIENFKLKKDDYLFFSYEIMQTKKYFSKGNMDAVDFELACDDKLLRFTREGFSIIAPPSHFNKTGYSVNDYELIKDEVPDPIVLQRVPGGYLIVSAWGEEASDPDVTNKINN